jgi:predicted glycosyltransferase involved in capsule biosynthesis
MKISVIIINYNQPTQASLLLETFGFQEGCQCDFEVILLDDGSFPTLASSLSLIRKYPLIYQHLPRSSISCRARARNQGVAQSSGDYLVFLDGDSVVNSTFISTYEQYFRSNLSSSLVLGTRTEMSRDLYKDISQVSSAQTLDILFRADKNTDERLAIVGKLGQPFNSIVGKWVLFTSCNFAIKRELFDQLGGFNETFIGWGSEDTEFAYRVDKSNIQYELIDNRVMHLPHVDNGEIPRNRYFEWLANLGRFYNIHGDSEILLLMYIDPIIYNCFVVGAGWSSADFLKAFLTIQKRLRSLSHQRYLSAE